MGIVKQHLAAGVAAVADLVFEALHQHAVACAIGPPAWHPKAGQRCLQRVGIARTAGHARHHQMRVGHGYRIKPFMALQAVGCAAPAAGIDRIGHRGVAAHVRPALLFGHAHAHPQSGLVRQRRIARVMAGAGDAAFYLRPQGRFLAQYRDGRRRHCGGAEAARFCLAMQVKTGGPGAPAAAWRLSDGIGSGCAGKRHIDQLLRAVVGEYLVPCGVKLHLVNAPAPRIPLLQLRWVAVGLVGPLRKGGTAHRACMLLQTWQPGLGLRARQGRLQGGVTAQRVVVDQLIHQVVLVALCHGCSPRCACPFYEGRRPMAKAISAWRSAGPAAGAGARRPAPGRPAAHCRRRPRRRQRSAATITISGTWRLPAGPCRPGSGQS